ncbi:MAG: ferric iron uptake transcriptional regulator [Ottowia sp.]|nr:ferric iron uptake transcriptional regulator [Ottowia sp.]
MDTINEIKSSGLKATLPRLKILEIFQRAEQRHMTAEDVYRHLLADDSSDIGLATVYRVLSQFEQAGLLTRSHFDTSKAVYELRDGEHHDHLVCLDCGTVLEFHDAAIERRQIEVAAARGFTLEDHSLSLYARCNRDNCPNCPQQSQ